MDCHTVVSAFLIFRGLYLPQSEEKRRRRNKGHLERTDWLIWVRMTHGILLHFIVWSKDHDDFTKKCSFFPWKCSSWTHSTCINMIISGILLFSLKTYTILLWGMQSFISHWSVAHSNTSHNESQGISSIKKMSKWPIKNRVMYSKYDRCQVVLH